MIDANVVSLETAGLADAEGLSDLLAHYVAELSPLFAIQADADGRFRYDKLPLYWTGPDRRFAFFIRSGQERVGVVFSGIDFPGTGSFESPRRTARRFRSGATPFSHTRAARSR